jgi:hypothetical protein
MTDFTNGFDPTKRFNGTQFNTNTHGKGAAPDQNASSSDAAPKADPYEGQRLSADEIFNLMGAQAKFNKAGVDNTGIFQSIAAFENALSPEAHAKMLQDVESTFQDEFGFAPGADFAENVVADHLIGRPAIQAF